MATPGLEIVEGSPDTFRLITLPPASARPESVWVAQRQEVNTPTSSCAAHTDTSRRRVQDCAAHWREVSVPPGISFVLRVGNKKARGRRPSGERSGAAIEQPAGEPEVMGHGLAALPVRIDTFSHPDFTVGSGVSPDRVCVLSRPLAGSTAGQDLTVISRRSHQTPKAMLIRS